MKNTKGPWVITYDAKGPTCINTEAFTTGPSICVMTRQGDHERAKFTDKDGGFPLDETSANARLIAAAPELLEVLHAVLFGYVEPDKKEYWKLLEKIEGPNHINAYETMKLIRRKE